VEEPTPTAPRHAGVPFPPPFVFVGAFGAGWLAERARPWPLPVAESLEPARVLLGWGAVAAGLALMLWGIATVWAARSTVLPFRPSSRLVRRGPYRFTRNPMYVGMSAAYVGGALLVASVWPALGFPFVLLVVDAIVIRREERYLASAFGADYDDYRRRVRRWL